MNADHYAKEASEGKGEMKYVARKRPHPSCGFTIQPECKCGGKYFQVTVHQVQDNVSGWTMLDQNDETEDLARRLADFLNER